MPSALWTSVVFTEVVRFLTAPVLLGWMLTESRLAEMLPYSFETFLGSAFFLWPLLLFASIAAAVVVARRQPRPAALLGASVGVSTIVVVLLLQAAFERSTMPLRYLVFAWRNF